MTITPDWEEAPDIPLMRVQDALRWRGHMEWQIDQRMGPVYAAMRVLASEGRLLFVPAEVTRVELLEACRAHGAMVKVSWSVTDPPLVGVAHSFSVPLHLVEQGESPLIYTYMLHQLGRDELRGERHW